MTDETWPELPDWSSADAAPMRPLPPPVEVRALVCRCGEPAVLAEHCQVHAPAVFGVRELEIERLLRTRLHVAYAHLVKCLMRVWEPQIPHDNVNESECSACKEWFVAKDAFLKVRTLQAELLARPR